MTSASAGLGAVGIALVASAAMRLTFSTCKDRTTMMINLAVGTRLSGCASHEGDLCCCKAPRSAEIDQATLAHAMAYHLNK